MLGGRVRVEELLWKELGKQTILSSTKASPASSYGGLEVLCPGHSGGRDAQIISGVQVCPLLLT